jgi:hypothetical protein
LLLHLQPRPFHVQRYNDITPLLLVPINLQSLVHASHRVSIRTRFGRFVWHSLDKHHGVCCGQWKIRILAREDYDRLVLGILRHGSVFYLWDLSHHVVDPDVYNLQDDTRYVELRLEHCIALLTTFHSMDLPGISITHHWTTCWKTIRASG